MLRRSQRQWVATTVACLLACLHACSHAFSLIICFALVSLLAHTRQSQRQSLRRSDGWLVGRSGRCDGWSVGRSDGWSVAATELICTAKHTLEEVKANSATEELPYIDKHGHGMLIKYWDEYFNEICGVVWVGWCVLQSMWIFQCVICNVPLFRALLGISKRSLHIKFCLCTLRLHFPT